MSLDFVVYQEQAASTDQVPKQRASRAGAPSLMMPLLGLAGETGSLLTEYKKWLIEGDAYTVIQERVAEELGDILWYLSNLATKSELSLDAIAAQNLRKIRARWAAAEDRRGRRLFDEAYPKNEQFPRHFTAILRDVTSPNGQPKVSVEFNKKVCGNPLTDNAHSEDGYRFHDVFHLAYMTHLGWSPIWRRILNSKRKSDPRVDEVEDGARAAIVEEAVSALVFSHAAQHSYYEGVNTVSYDLLRDLASITSKFEVGTVSPRAWETAILSGYSAWRKVRRHGGGVLEGDLLKGTLKFRKLNGTALPSRRRRR